MSVTTDDDDDIPGLLPDGRPDPAYPASLGIIRASAGRRSAAFAFDAAFFSVLLAPVLIGAVPLILGIVSERPDPSRWATHPDFLTVVVLWAISQGLVTIFTIVQLSLHGVKGVTAGKAMMGIRSVSVFTFGKPGFWRIVLRALVMSAAFTVVPYLGVVPFLLSPLWDPEKRGRGWHDRIGRNWLIDARRGLDPFDSKALRNARRALTAPTIPEGQDLPSLATGTAWAGPTFVPSARSSSGVISHAGSDVLPKQAEYTPPSSPAARAATTPGASMVFDDGTVLTVTGSGLLGRNPEARVGEVVDHLFRIDDPHRQLSKTHLAFGIDNSGFWIMDCGSSNGTFLTTNSGAVLALTAMEKSRVPSGAVVEVGDRTFTVRETP